jgi:hypothetical protein
MYKEILIAFFVINTLFAQNYNTDIDKLATYSFGKEDIGMKITLNELNEIQFVTIIDSLDYSREKLFSKIQSYFAYYYKDSKNVLQQQDKENGIIIGKGYYGDFSSYSNSTNYFTTSVFYGLYYSASHTIRTDIKEGKVRIIITVSDYDIKCSPDLQLLCQNTKRIIDCEPFSPNYNQYDHLRIGGMKPAPKLLNFYIETLKRAEPQAFVDLCKTVLLSVEQFEKSIKEGNIKAEKDEW